MAELERVLSYKAILLISINAMMGSGIFFLPAIGALDLGAFSFWAWLIMGFVAINLSMVFAELVGMYPQSGGVYEFSKKAFNIESAFFVGFTTLLTSYVGIALLMVAAVQYLIPHGPMWLSAGVAIVLVLLFHAIAYRGMGTSAVMLMTFACIGVGSLLLVIIPGFFSFSPGNITAIFSMCSDSGTCATSFGLFALVFLIAETFFGWEGVSFLAGETKDGARRVPQAMIIATLVSVGLALLLVISAFGSVGAGELAKHTVAPFTFLATHHYGALFLSIAPLLVYLAFIGQVAGSIVSTPRLISSMADDKLFISQFSKIHPLFKSPHRAIVFQCVLVILLILFAQSSYQTLLYLFIPLALLEYGLVVLMLVVLRYKAPDHPRTFRMPGHNLLPLWILPVFVFFTVMWTITTPNALHILSIGASLLFLGFPIFLLLKTYYDPDFIIKMNDLFAWLAYLTERIALPRQVREEILLLVGDIHGKRVLEYGCSVGTLTVQIADKVSRNGAVYATNISRKELDISRKRVLRRGNDHVIFIHDSHQVNRVHPDIPHVDVIVSFGMLTAMQDVRKILKEMHDVLEKNGRICLVDYTNYFHVIPDVEWITSDEKIKETFRECGFSVTVTRRKGKLWDYLYIHGVRTDAASTNMVYI